mgnify:FL=1|jgi:hypothetical protein
MKVSKKKLRKIIREERARLLGESVVDMTTFEDVIQKAAGDVGDAFVKHMNKLPTESPEVLADLGIDEATWADALNEAVLELDSAVFQAISDTVEGIEAELTGGGYAGASDRRTGGYGEIR